MKNIFPLFFLIMFVVPAHSFEQSAFSMGFGYYSQNILNKISVSETGKTGFLGSTSYPIIFKYDMAFSMDWYFSPQLSYTLLPRTSDDGATKTTILNLLFAFGKNFESWDWYVGPGFVRYSMKGSGGTKVLSNGTSTSTFALPDRTVEAQSFTANAGAGYNFDKSRLGFDLIIENILSSKKRSESFMLNYTYRFGGYL